jgi:hypothetical protein
VSNSTGTDPWFLLPGDFQEAGIDGSFDLFVPFGLDQASFSPLGSVELSASYESAAGIDPLFGILLNSSGATVTPGSLPGLQYYDLVPDAGGGSATYQQVDIATILALLQSDLSGGVFSEPLDLGVLVPSLPLPTTAIDSNGALAEYSVTATASDAAVGPEPSSSILILAGMGLVAARYCSKRTSSRAKRRSPSGHDDVAVSNG